MFTQQERPQKPDVEWMTELKWNAACDLHDSFEVFLGIHDDLTLTRTSVTLGDVEVGRVSLCVKRRRVEEIYFLVFFS